MKRKRVFVGLVYVRCSDLAYGDTTT